MLQQIDPETADNTAVTATSTSNNTYNCCCLTFEMLPPVERNNNVMTYGDKLRTIWNFYWDYIHLPLVQSIKACIPVIVLIAYLSQPDYQHGLVFTGVYAYMMTFYYMQWFLYECPLVWNKNDMYGSYLNNVPAYYWFMNNYYTSRVMGYTGTILATSLIIGWSIMAAETYKRQSVVIIPLALAIMYAILKTYLCIACAILKFEAVYCNKSVPICPRPTYVLPAIENSLIATDEEIAAERANVSTWHCICCIVKAQSPIISVIVAVLGILTLTYTFSYISLSMILATITINNDGSYCKNPILSVFVAVTNLIYFTAPHIKYYLHNIDPQNTRFERIEFLNKHGENTFMQVYYSTCCIGFVTCIISWICVTQCYSTRHLGTALSSLYVLCNLFYPTLNIIQCICDMSYSEQYNKELEALHTRTPATTEVVNPMMPTEPSAPQSHLLYTMG